MIPAELDPLVLSVVWKMTPALGTHAPGVRSLKYVCMVMTQRSFLAAFPAFESRRVAPLKIGNQKWNKSMVTIRTVQLGQVEHSAVLFVSNLRSRARVIFGERVRVGIGVDGFLSSAV